MGRACQRVSHPSPMITSLGGALRNLKFDYKNCKFYCVLPHVAFGKFGSMGNTPT